MTLKDIFEKANMNALAGWPISFVLNLSFLPLFADWLKEEPFSASIVIGIVFYIASVIRLTIFDYVYLKFGFDINPSNYIKKILNKRKFFS